MFSQICNKRPSFGPEGSRDSRGVKSGQGLIEMLSERLRERLSERLIERLIER